MLVNISNILGNSKPLKYNFFHVTIPINQDFMDAFKLHYDQFQ